VATMERAREIALKKLDYVYLGNVPGLNASNTYCPECNELLISRRSYLAEYIGLVNKKCRKCGREINVVDQNNPNQLV